MSKISIRVNVSECGMVRIKNAILFKRTAESVFAYVGRDFISSICQFHFNFAERI